jgi:hypothetical protein
MEVAGSGWQWLAVAGSDKAAVLRTTVKSVIMPASVLTTNIRLGWKWLSVTNTLAYILK